MNFLQKFELQGKGKKPVWSGTIEWKVPLNHERLVVISESGAASLQKPAADASDAEKMNIFKEYAPTLGKLYGMVRHLIISVNLEGPGEEKIVTLEEFETHPDMLTAVGAVAMQYVRGFGPGKTKSPS